MTEPGPWGLTAECCCDAECPTFIDDFNRAPSTDLGPSWEEVEEDSEIQLVGGHQVLMVPGDDDSDGEGGIAICQVRPWDHEGSHYLDVQIVNREHDTTQRIIFFYCNVENFFWVSLYHGNPNAEPPIPNTVSVGVREAGVDRLLHRPAPESDDAVAAFAGEAHDLRIIVCYAGSFVVVKCPGTSVFPLRAVIEDVNFPWPTEPPEPKCGLGSGPDNPSYFDSYYSSPEWTWNPKCPMCCCGCDNEGVGGRVNLPATLTLVIDAYDEPGGVNDCTAPSPLTPWLDGRSCLLDASLEDPCVTWENEGLPRRPDSNKLPYDPPDPDPLCGGFSIGGFFLFRLVCGLTTQGFRLWLAGTPLCPEGGYIPNENSNCTYLEFGPYNFGCCRDEEVEPPAYYGQMMLTFKVTA